MPKYWLEYMPKINTKSGAAHIYFEPYILSGVELISFYNPAGRKKTMTKEKARIRWDELIKQGWYRVEK